MRFSPTKFHVAISHHRRARTIRADGVGASISRRPSARRHGRRGLMPKCRQILPNRNRWQKFRRVAPLTHATSFGLKAMGLRLSASDRHSGSSRRRPRRWNRIGRPRFRMFKKFSERPQGRSTISDLLISAIRRVPFRAVPLVFIDRTQEFPPMTSITSNKSGIIFTFSGGVAMPHICFH
jgi:hypothetical protein